MGVKFSYIIGLFLCWGASIFSSMGNILFKYHELLTKKTPEYASKNGFSWWWVAIGSQIIGAVAALISFSLIPLSINCVHAALPIFLGEVFSGWILPQSALDRTQWVLIALILGSVSGVVAFGDHETDDDVAEKFEDHFSHVEAITYFSSIIVIGVFAFLNIFLNPIPDPVTPCSLYNISGPVLTAIIGNVTQVSARICMTTIKCNVSTCEDVYIADEWYALFALLPISAVCQLKSVSFAMGKLHIVTVIPIYGTLLIVLPSISGVLMLGEEPTDINWYAFFISLIVVFNVCFVYISEQKKQLRDANGGLLPVRDCLSYHAVEEVGRELSKSRQSSIAAREDSAGEEAGKVTLSKAGVQEI